MCFYTMKPLDNASIVRLRITLTLEAYIVIFVDKL